MLEFSRRAVFIGSMPTNAGILATTGITGRPCISGEHHGLFCGAVRNDLGNNEDSVHVAVHIGVLVVAKPDKTGEWQYVTRLESSDLATNLVQPHGRSMPLHFAVLGIADPVCIG